MTELLRDTHFDCPFLSRKHARSIDTVHLSSNRKQSWDGQCSVCNAMQSSEVDEL
jgi:hypothetical protein